jgi:hypothetical protein
MFRLRQFTRPELGVEVAAGRSRTGIEADRAGADFPAQANHVCAGGGRVDEVNEGDRHDVRRAAAGEKGRADAIVATDGYPVDAEVEVDAMVARAGAVEHRTHEADKNVAAGGGERELEVGFRLR